MCSVLTIAIYISMIIRGRRKFHLLVFICRRISQVNDDIPSIIKFWMMECEIYGFIMGLINKFECYLVSCHLIAQHHM